MERSVAEKMAHALKGSRGRLTADLHAENQDMAYGRVAHTVVNEKIQPTIIAEVRPLYPGLKLCKFCADGQPIPDFYHWSIPNVKLE
jgi:hypothetical protein